MAQIIIGERVVNKSRESGTIVSFENNVITVAFGGRVARFTQDAFENDFLKYEDAQLQRKTEECIAQAKAARQAEEKRIAEIKETKKLAEIKKEHPSTAINIEAASVRLDAVPVTMNTVSKKHKPLVQEIFAECEKDTHNLYALFKPKMEYLRYTSQSRSRYCVGFLTKYLDTYVFRVFSREDIYKKRKRTGVTVMKSDTTEILRVLYIDHKFYYFSKNISTAMQSLSHTAAYGNWHSSVMAYAILLNDVVRCCDCGYLNDYIAVNNEGCLQYLHLLFSALHSNKVEIVFKHKRFLSTYRIADLAGYLEEFSSKQIDFASKNDVIHTLPLIKRHGLYDADVLQKLEMLMQKRRFSNSVYDHLNSIFQRLNFDLSVLDRKLIHFLKRIDHFNASIYDDYILDLYELPGVTIDDFFDNNYIERHTILSREKRNGHDEALNAEYTQVIKELQWIDREDNGYYISIPKSIEAFKYEGDVQHNCVYTNAYYSKVITRRSIIVFLRKSPDIPYVTIEYDYETFAILQALGKYNTRVPQDLYEYIVRLGKQLRYELLSQ